MFILLLGQTYWRVFYTDGVFCSNVNICVTEIRAISHPRPHEEYNKCLNECIVVKKNWFSLSLTAESSESYQGHVQLDGGQMGMIKIQSNCPPSCLRHPWYSKSLEFRFLIFIVKLTFSALCFFNISPTSGVTANSSSTQGNSSPIFFRSTPSSECIRTGWNYYFSSQKIPSNKMVAERQNLSMCHIVKWCLKNNIRT